MAIEKTVTLNNGLTVQNSYIRIESFAGTKEKVNLTICSYVSKQAHEDGKSAIDYNNKEFVPDSNDTAVNIIKQGYEYLKTLPEYADAVDC